MCTPGGASSQGAGVLQRVLERVLGRVREGREGKGGWGWARASFLGNG